MSGDLDKMVRRLSRIAHSGLSRAIASGMSPADALRLAAVAAAAVIVNAAVTVTGGDRTEAAASATTHEFRAAFLKFLRIARAKDPADPASHPTPTKH